MKLTSLPQKIYRNLSRAREIIAVLIKYGLADWISWLDLEFAKDLFKHSTGEALARQTRETRIRLALTELGPTFIKLGQILSTRPDLIDAALADQLQKLQDRIPADPPATVRSLIEAELREPLEDLFQEFEETPLASASIGQVHPARLKTGESVVVKVQRAGIMEKIRTDVDILSGLAQLAELHPELKNYRPKETVGEFQRTLLRELDFGREERHLQQFAFAFRDDPRIHIPPSFLDYSTSRVLTMERIEGIPVSDVEALSAAGVDTAEVARRGAELYLEMIFTHGSYHADPHPGNIFIERGDVIALLDFGMVGHIDDELREQFEDMLLALGEGNSARLTEILMRLGSAPGHLNRAALAADVHEFTRHYTHVPLDRLDLSRTLTELADLIRRYQILLPSRVALLIKVLVMLEGTSRLLHPSFNLSEILLPQQRKLMRKRFSPARQLRRMRHIYVELEHLAENLPRGILDIIQQVRSGKFDVHLDHRGLEPSVNRLVLGIITGSVFVGASLLLSRNTAPVIDLPPYLPNLSIFGACCFLAGIGMALRLLWAVRKSGRLDQGK